VDLLNTNDKTLKRYMGETESNRYLAFHRSQFDNDALQAG
jgi:hypothetical protein